MSVSNHLFARVAVDACYIVNMSISHDAGVIPVFDLSDRLRKAREVTGLEQQPFADDLGVSRTTISNAERGARRPSRLVMRAWALRTGVPVAWLETGQVPTGGSGPGEYTPRDSNPEPTGLEHSRPDLRLVIGDAA